MHKQNNNKTVSETATQKATTQFFLKNQNKPQENEAWTTTTTTKTFERNMKGYLWKKK